MFSAKFTHMNDRGNTLYLRLISERKAAVIALGVQITPEDLADILESKTPKPSNLRWLSTFRFWCNKLDEIKADLIMSGNTRPDVRMVKEMFQRSVDESCSLESKVDESKMFGRFYRKCVDAKANRGYKESCQYTLKKMLEFCSDKESDFCCDFDRLTFEDITLKWLNGFDEWLTRNGAAKNTRNIHFKNIRTCLNRAIDEELTNNYPFRRFKISGKPRLG